MSEAGHCPGPDDIQCCYSGTSQAPTQTPTPTACTINSGQSGTCISTSACASQGWKSEAGHCPGATDIQCCYKLSETTNTPAPSPTSCTVNSGESGTCISTSSCASQGLQSEPDHCPGPTDIQCCYQPSQTSAAPAPSTTSCTVNSGESGTCISTSSCASQGLQSEPDHCPGPTDIQCCYKPSATAAPSTTSCTVNSGESGTCISTSSCASQGLQSEPDHCPGPTDIQCCYQPSQTSATPVPSITSCKVSSGESGTCISTSSCAAQGGNSEAGHCPGPADIQCCYYPSRTTFATSSKSMSTSSATQPSVTCGSTVYSQSEVNDAKNAGCSHVRANTKAGGSKYPHIYRNDETFRFTVPPPFYEFPMMKASLYTGGDPGTDRVIFDSSCTYGGSITHTGASEKNGFVGCSDTSK